MEHPEWDTPAYFNPGPHQIILRKLAASAFNQRTQQEWKDIFSKNDCCVEPVLTLDEAAQHVQKLSDHAR